MRPFEVVLVLLVTVGAIRPATRWRVSATLATAVAVLTLLATGVHLTIERPRWQLLPVYLVAAVIVAVAAYDAARRTSEGRIRRAPWVLALVLTLAGAGLAWALPVADLAPPEGPAAIGTRTFELIDPDRSERYGDGPSQRRRIVVQLWYPADVDTTSGEPAPWLPASDGAVAAAASWWDLPAFALGHLRLVRGNAVADAPPDRARGPRPLVLYSHAWSGFRGAQASLLESLASRGYVVAAVDHTYGSIATVFPDGEVVPIAPEALPNGVDRETYEEAAATLVQTYADDLRLVLDHFGQSEPALDQLVDLDQVGVIGHSAGGGAAILLCASDPRCGAALTYDPWVEPLPDEIVGAGLHQPLLSLRSEEWVGNKNDSRLRRLHAAAQAPDGLVEIRGALHRDFTLMPRLTPVAPWLGLSGATGCPTVHGIVDAWTTQWFDHHLRSWGVDPLVRPPEHPASILEET